MTEAAAGPPLIVRRHPSEDVARLQAALRGRAILKAVPDTERFGIGKAGALLTHPAAMRGVNRETPRPDGWPGRLRCVHLGSTGIDRMPDCCPPERFTVSRGAQAEALARMSPGGISSLSRAAGPDRHGQP